MRCSPSYDRRMKALTPDELSTALAQIPLWHIESGKLTRTWAFGTFSEAMFFVNQVAALAEQQNHHPDIYIRYNEVQLVLISHDVNALSGRDLRLALLMDGQPFGEKK
jgi:4a-hydroxytetrahydrobiopterin dehydratase